MTDTAKPDAPGEAAEEPAEGRTTEPGQRSAEERAEALMERAGAGVGRFLTRAVARTREEIEDVVAEAQAIRHGQRPSAGPGEGKSPDEGG